jgi:HTH-type transcriptional regulator, bacterioopsin transcriptional activator and related proteins
VRSRPQVLVVEDDPDTRAAVAETLSEEFVVSTAPSGEQALEVADAMRYTADVVIVDLDLGVGMNGEQFAAAYRKRTKGRMRMIVLSGVYGAYDIARQMHAAASITKPYDADELINTVRILAPKPPPQRAAHL